MTSVEVEDISHQIVTWCLDPTISLIADKYAGKAIVCKVDVDRAPAIVQQYNVADQ